MAVLDLQDGTLSTTSIITFTVLVMGTCLYTGMYFMGLRRAMNNFDSILDGKATYTFTEETIQAKSSLGSLSLAWSALTEVRCYHDLVLLGFHGVGYSTIPAAQIPSETLTYLLDRARTHGVKIRDFDS